MKLKIILENGDLLDGNLLDGDLLDVERPTRDGRFYLRLLWRMFRKDPLGILFVMESVQGSRDLSGKERFSRDPVHNERLWRTGMCLVGKDPLEISYII